MNVAVLDSLLKSLFKMLGLDPDVVKEQAMNAAKTLQQFQANQDAMNAKLDDLTAMVQTICLAMEIKGIIKPAEDNGNGTQAP